MTDNPNCDMCGKPKGTGHEPWCPWRPKFL